MTQEQERVAFEADAAPMGFDLTRQSIAVSEPWTEYADENTGHRWAGWQARAALDEALLRQAMEALEQTYYPTHPVIAALRERLPK